MTRRRSPRKRSLSFPMNVVFPAPFTPTTGIFLNRFINQDNPAGNQSGWLNPQFKTLVQQASTELDATKRKALLGQIGQKSIALNGIYTRRQLGQQSSLVSGAGADFENNVLRAQMNGFQHCGHNFL